MFYVVKGYADRIDHVDEKYWYFESEELAKAFADNLKEIIPAVWIEKSSFQTRINLTREEIEWLS